MRLFIHLWLSLMMMVISSCASVTKQAKKQAILDASQEGDIEGTGTSSADIRSMAERMALEINALEWPVHSKSITIALDVVDNQTRFPLNPHLIKDRLLTDLVELAKGTPLVFSENPKNAHYLLTTRITALSKGSSQGVNDYLLYSFKLLQGDIIIWAKAYETKKQGSVGIMYR